MLVELGPGYSAVDALPSVLADIGRFIVTPYATSYRVIGNTGIVCMSSGQQAKKWEKTSDCFTRTMLVYVNESSNWKLLSWYSSDIPLKK